MVVVAGVEFREEARGGWFLYTGVGVADLASRPRSRPRSTAAPRSANSSLLASTSSTWQFWQIACAICTSIDISVAHPASTGGQRARVSFLVDLAKAAVGGRARGETELAVVHAQVRFRGRIVEGVDDSDRLRSRRRRFRWEASTPRAAPAGSGSPGTAFHGSPPASRGWRPHGARPACATWARASGQDTPRRPRGGRRMRAEFVVERAAAAGCRRARSQGQRAGAEQGHPDPRPPASGSRACLCTSRGTHLEMVAAVPHPLALPGRPHAPPCRVRLHGEGGIRTRDGT